MKTSVTMKRELIGVPIRQDSKSGMLNANDLHSAGNLLRKNKGLPEKQLQSYFTLDSTSELISELMISEGLAEECVKKAKRGKDGGTWVHPILFIDMAMWYSPELKIKVIKWAIDGLLLRRNESGESFKAAMSALTESFPQYFEKPISYAKVANAISAACGVGTDEDKWQRATEQQLQLRDKIQEHIVLLADVCSSAPDCVNKSIEKAKKKVFAIEPPTER